MSTFLFVSGLCNARYNARCNARYNTWCNIQVPAFLILSTLFWSLRHLWRRARVAKGRDPIEQLRAEMVEITLLLARAERRLC